MAFTLRRVALAAGAQVTAEYDEGARGVYLVEGEHPEMGYAAPVQVPVGGRVELMAENPITVGILEEVDDGVH